MSMKKSTLSSLVAALLTAILLPARAAEKTSSRPWNILVVLLDDAGWHDLGFAGNGFVDTPNMDRLAHSGMRFPTAYATHPFCAPSRQSLVTGQWPARTAWKQRTELENPDAPHGAPPYVPKGACTWTKRRPEFTSLAEVLKAKGYATAHIGKWHFENLGGDGVWPENEGFDFNFGGSPNVGEAKSHFAPYKNVKNQSGEPDAPEGEYLTDRLTDEAIKFIRKHKDDPFYMQLWHYAPHTPIQAPEKLVEKYRRKKAKLSDDQLNPTYAAMIERVDQQLGKILQTLSKFGLDKNTLIILASDNGGRAIVGSVPITTNAPLRGYKRLIYEGGVRIPMAIYWPGHTQPGSVGNEPVSLIDLYPTILEVAGADCPTNQPMDGQSLVPLLETGRQPELTDRPLFWYNVTSAVEPDGSVLLPVASVLKGPWRLIRHYGLPLELYHEGDDPSETTDLAALDPERVQALESLLDEWLESAGVALPTRNPAYDPDYVVSRQIPNSAIPPQAKAVREWDMADRDSPWNANGNVEEKRENGALRMRSTGLYPAVGTKEVADLPAGIYAVQVELCIATDGGRVRFDWQAGNGRGSVEFLPRRDGKWHTLTGLFKAREPLTSLQFAGPTHLGYAGQYDPKRQPDYIEVRSIRLISLDPELAERKGWMKPNPKVSL